VFVFLIKQLLLLFYLNDFEMINLTQKSVFFKEFILKLNVIYEKSLTNIYLFEIEKTKSEIYIIHSVLNTLNTYIKN
jgi:hypothetical protein